MDIRSLKNVLKLLSLINLALSVFFTLPILTGFLYDEPYRHLLIFNALLFSFSALLYLILHKHKVTLSLKEGIVSVNAIWVMLSLLGAVPLLLYSDITFAQALFESVSGFSTTGATIYSDVEALPKMVLMHRSLMQWLGGMGIIVLGVGLFSLINPSGSLTLFKAESTGIKMDKMTPKIKDTAMRIWGIYLLLTLLDALLLRLEGMDTFDALNHAFTTIATAGFSTRNDSFGYFDDPLILWTTIFFMLAAGVNFLAHLRLFYGDFSGYKTEENRWYLGIFLLLASILSIQHYLTSSDTLVHTVTHASFTVASILTTTGYNTVDHAAWGQMAISIIFVAMLIGGNAGSTSGGVKVIRYVVVTKSVIAELKRVLHPNAIIDVFLDKTLVNHKVLHATYVFFALFSISVVIVTLTLYARGYDSLTSISSAIATVGNIGPGFSLIAPGHDYSFFQSADLYILSIAMIAGRLEFFTVLLLFSPNLWKKF